MTQIFIDSIILFITFFWQAYMQALIITLLFNIETSQKENILYSIIFGIYGTIAKLFIPLEYSSINTIIILTLMILIIKLLYRKTIKESILYSLVLTLISIPTEMISSVLLFNFLKFETNIENVIETIPLFWMINIWFSIIAIITYIFKNKSKLESFSNSEIANKKSLYINILLIVFIISPNIMFYATNQYNYPLYLLIFNIVANIILVVLSVYNTYKNVQLEKKKQALKLSEQHNKTLSTLLDSIRTFKHDYSNVVHSIGGYISFEDMEGLKKYYAGLTRETKKTAQLESISPQKITEPSVYTLFSTKHEDAYAKDILFCVETMYDYRKLAMPIFDFCKILGIFLDNSIEAAEESTEREIHISFRRIADEKLQVFTIENTYKNKNVDTEKIFEKDFSTKNRNSGIGLWEVKNIVDRNINVNLITSKDDKFFTQRLFISEELLDD